MPKILSQAQIEELQVLKRQGYTYKQMQALTGATTAMITLHTKHIQKALVMLGQEEAEAKVYALRYDDRISRDLMKTMTRADCGSFWVEWRNRSSRKLCAARKIIYRSCKWCADCEYFKVKQVR